MSRISAAVTLAVALALAAGAGLLHSASASASHDGPIVRPSHPIDGGPPVYPARAVNSHPLPTAIHPITPR